MFGSSFMLFGSPEPDHFDTVGYEGKGVLQKQQLKHDYKLLHEGLD